MWGGLTLTPKNCISTITIQWYVPNAVKHVSGQPSYSILVQKQGGYIPTVQITVDTSAVPGLKPFNFQGDIVADRLFTLSSLRRHEQYASGFLQSYYDVRDTVGKGLRPSALKTYTTILDMLLLSR